MHLSIRYTVMFFLFVDQKRRYVYALASLIKSLADVPEQVRGNQFFILYTDNSNKFFAILYFF